MTHFFILADPWPNTLMLFIFIFKQECVNNLLFSVFLVDFVLKCVQKISLCFQYLIWYLLWPRWFHLSDFVIMFLWVGNKINRNNFRSSNTYKISRVPKSMLFELFTFRHILIDKYEIVRNRYLYYVAIPHHIGLPTGWRHCNKIQSKHKLQPLMIWWINFHLEVTVVFK